MTDFARTHTFSAGAKVKAAEHNDNWDDAEAFLNTTGVHKFQATKLQAKRVAWTNSNAELTVTWDTPFADSNYTVSVAFEQNSTAELSNVKIKSKSATQVVLRYAGQTADLEVADGVTVHLIAVHD